MSDTRSEFPFLFKIGITLLTISAISLVSTIVIGISLDLDPYSPLIRLILSSSAVAFSFGLLVMGTFILRAMWGSRHE